MGAVGASRLLERESFLDALGEAQRQVEGGSGRLVFITGEAGVGKTAFVRGFCSDAAGELRVLERAYDALFTPRRLAPFADVAAETGGAPADLIERDARPHEAACGSGRRAAAPADRARAGRPPLGRRGDARRPAAARPAGRGEGGPRHGS